MSWFLVVFDSPIHIIMGILLFLWFAWAALWASREIRINRARKERMRRGVCYLCGRRKAENHSLCMICYDRTWKE
jgi:hypothetical protein